MAKDCRLESKTVGEQKTKQDVVDVDVSSRPVNESSGFCNKQTRE